MQNLKCMEEEFNNFMYKVNEVSNIVHKMRSDDPDLQKIATLEADKYLKCANEKCIENIDENTVELVVKSNRSVINKKALLKDDKDPNAMSQEAFMEEVSRDAEQRYQNKLVRKEKSETYKKRGTLAFRRGEYEKALSCYNNAIEQIKDSCQLYLNRCLTFINLKLYEKAIADAKTALRLNENSLKGWLLLAKAHFKDENVEEFERAIKEARERNAEHDDFINEFVENLKK